MFPVVPGCLRVVPAGYVGAVRRMAVVIKDGAFGGGIPAYAGMTGWVGSRFAVRSAALYSA